jgi:NADPH:quinone reductase-like Zn-dependent oxidoreductase
MFRQERLDLGHLPESPGVMGAVFGGMKHLLAVHRVVDGESGLWRADIVFQSDVDQHRRIDHRREVVPIEVLKCLAHLLFPFVGQKLGTFISKENHEDMIVLKELIEAGKVTPVIDKTYSLSEIPEAIGYVGEGQAQGKVVITL